MLPQTGWLTVIESSSLTGLEDWSWGVRGGPGSGGESCLPSLAQQAPGIPWLVAASLQTLPLSSRGLFSVSVSALVEILATQFRAHQDNPEYFHLKVLNFPSSNKTVLSEKIHIFQLTINPCWSKQCTFQTYKSKILTKNSKILWLPTKKTDF